MKVLFIPVKAKLEPREILEGIQIPFKKIGLCTTAQFISYLKELKSALEEKGHEVKIGKPRATAIKPGQILGCDVSAAQAIENEVDAFLYIGTGTFHPLGIAAQTSKPVLILNPFTKELKALSEDEKQKFVKRKIQTLAKFESAKKIGILVSIKPGQRELQAQAKNLKELLEAKGKKVYLFICDNILDSELQNFMTIDAWVNTACPRLADDFFSKPFVNALDLMRYVYK